MSQPVEFIARYLKNCILRKLKLKLEAANYTNQKNLNPYKKQDPKIKIQRFLAINEQLLLLNRRFHTTITVVSNLLIAMLLCRKIKHCTAIAFSVASGKQ